MCLYEVPPFDGRYNEQIAAKRKALGNENDYFIGGWRFVTPEHYERCKEHYVRVEDKTDYLYALAKWTPEDPERSIAGPYKGRTILVILCSPIYPSDT